ncbi:MAG: Hsp33 family molecular chaperone HslO [Bacteroidota bacterium]|nr:Hsp33 family molecular chaperone HslO [Candidatus Kapabacteria bacterium]MCS7302809.1 Hsp33 family molecular chaperone HslO [Candidatus Kapabacteria bacterium]MCX7937045.1 Hsp33 family molecular chaperone HslO [Chlorobiota bacterium]MDW8075516.1 Hsp33 family molecular chaperone HslO [Bacteroidota bacterium]MDW8272373.1 Hsp33 family molecular chaperone HslO [Bacteroidota bacterium]
MNLSIAELKQRYRTRDRVIHAMAGKGTIRAAVVVSTATAREAQRRHQLEAVGAVLLARALSAASMMASFLKGEERVIVEAKGQGFIRTVYAEALQTGEVRGFVEYNPSVNGQTTPLGKGILQVRKILYNKAEPITGIVALSTGNITTDLAHYFWQSEQIPTGVRLDVTLDSTKEIECSAGILVQALPGADARELRYIYDFLSEIDSLCELVKAGYNAEEITRQTLPGDVEIFSSTPVDFFCRCSKERFKALLLSVGEEEIVRMRDAGQNELVCQYCGERYYLEANDFEELLNQLRSARN